MFCSLKSRLSLLSRRIIKLRKASMFAKINRNVDPPVFWGANFCLFFIVLFAVFFESRFNASLDSLKQSFITSFGWSYIVLSVVLILILLFIVFKFGSVRIGGEHAVSDFTTLSWVSMLFSAGLGTGLIYSGVFEPMAHFFKAPQIQNFSGEQKFVEAMDITFFHWGLPPWMMYSAAGLMFSIVGFNLNKGFQFAYFIPEERKIFKAVVNVFSILSILVGVVTTFVVASSQMSAGMIKVLPESLGSFITPELTIGAVTVMATFSVLSGLNKGIRILSQVNVLLALSLFLYVLFNVDLAFYSYLFFKSLGVHSLSLPKHLFYSSFVNDKSWLSNWTLLYWAWWVSWIPFVGLFIARISRGRTIKEYVLGTVLLPSFVTFLWFSLFGTAGYLKDKDYGLNLEGMLSGDVQNMLFAVLDTTPWASLFSVVAVVCVMIFYVTSSDSGSYVVDMIASGKKENHHPYLKIYWSILEGVLAIVLLSFGGVGLIKNLIVLFSLPVLVYTCFGLVQTCFLLKTIHQKEV